MRIDYLRGFRRLGWVLVGISFPAIAFFSYQESREFSGFSKERIAQLYPKLSGAVFPPDLVDPSRLPVDTYGLIPEFTFEDAISVLNAERNGTIEPRKRDVLAELRTRNEFPNASEVETKRLNPMKFAGMVVLIEAGIIVLIQGGISIFAWVVRGFIKEA